jgi:uncharacterized membrane protein SpoIIM required for sporulation
LRTTLSGIANIDRFIREHEQSWLRLDELTARVRRKPKGMNAAERTEFLDLYQRTSAHLSQLRSQTPDRDLDARLTRLLADASGALYGQSEGGARAIATFVRETFPAALWHIRRYVGIATLLFLVPAVITALWVGLSDDVRSTIPPAVAETYVNEDFEDYYSSEAAAEFATSVFINNIWVSFLAYAAGIVFCIGTAFVLISNGVLIGQAAGLFIDAGQLPRFFGLILPHGFLELTAIVIAGGAGLVLGWTVIAPGDRSRSDALAEEGRRSVVVVLGLIVVFLAAALIEGFVTGSPLSTFVRVGIGASSWVAFLLYVAVYGRRAAALGKTGQWGDSRPSWEDGRDEILSSRATVGIGQD